MKIDSFMAPSVPATMQSRAQNLEAQGFDAVWTYEAQHDAFLPLAYAAAATHKLEIGTNIAVAFARSPFSMAQIAWDLQAYSGGRFHLGLGTQVRPHVERRFSMPFDQPAARITDYVRCVRAIWDTFQSGTRPNYTGPFYQFRLINPFFNPGPLTHPDIPIYLAGVNPRMCRAAGEVADGFHVHPFHSAGYLREVVCPALEAGVRATNRTLADVTLYSPIFVVTGDTQAQVDKMARAVREQIAFYGSTPSYRAMLEYHDYGDLGKKLHDLMRQGDVAAMTEAIPDDLLDKVAIIATPDEIGPRIRDRYDGLLQRVSLYDTGTMGLDDSLDDARWRRVIDAVRSP